jgi:hypothetical protein
MLAVRIPGVRVQAGPSLVARPRHVPEAAEVAEHGLADAGESLDLLGGQQVEEVLRTDSTCSGAASLAKAAETLDRLSGGRLILGLGGGYSDDEFRAFGLGVPSPREKVDGLAEAITIVRGLWSQPEFSFEGHRYRTVAAAMEPKPDHRIPIWLGTFGDRALAVTGRLADGWIPSLGHASAEELTVMRKRVLGAASEAGRDPSQITCALNLQVQVDERAKAGPSVLAGSAGAVAAGLTGFVRAGFTALNFIAAGSSADEQAERLAREVLPEATAAT